MKLLITALILLSFNSIASSTYKLTIKKSNGDIYWVERFKSQESLDRWLDEEKTRKYWKASYVVSIDEITNPAYVETQEEKDKKDRIEELKAKDKNIKLDELVELLQLKGVI
jgi:hypothetical protein